MRITKPKDLVIQNAIEGMLLLSPRSLIQNGKSVRENQYPISCVVKEHYTSSMILPSRTAGTEQRGWGAEGFSTGILAHQDLSSTPPPSDALLTLPLRVKRIRGDILLNDDVGCGQEMRGALSTAASGLVGSEVGGRPLSPSVLTSCYHL